ncbi:MAG TPA: glycosyltransferase, partial [Solirubrobacteraceae bacterium]
MRIALVSPYSWTYPGGVTRHIEALSRELLATGHDVRVLTPFDPPDRLAARLHRGHAPEPRALDEDLVIPLGRTVGFPANGAVSNLASTPAVIARMRHELATGGYDVVHLHEPVAPVIGWDALMSTRVPLVGTFHCYSDNVVSNNIANLLGARRRLNRLGVRIAVSEAAAWTGRRFYGGRYRIIPNGVEVPPDPLALHVPSADTTLRIAFIGQAVERKGLPVLLRAFEALRDHVPATLTLVGVTAEDVAPVLEDQRGVRALGKVDDDTKHAALREADVLCAPSLGGESFGMVLTEAFAAGVPVVASHIAGYADVVRDGVDGLLVPRGDATALAEALRKLALDPAGRARMAHEAATHAQRYAWPRVAAEVVEAYEDAIAVPVADSAPARVALRHGLTPADRKPAIGATRLASLDPEQRGSRAGRAALRRAGLAVLTLAGAAAGWFALQRIGVDKVSTSLVDSSPPWVLVALALMCASMVVRALAWHQILRAALPGAAVRRRDALQGTMIGVLMSATLPARLGEPARAMIVARRIGRPRETLPVVAGTIVSQTLLNILALVILGVTMFSTVHYFDGNHTALVVFAIAPVAILLAVLA